MRIFLKTEKKQKNFFLSLIGNLKRISLKEHEASK